MIKASGSAAKSRASKSADGEQQEKIERILQRSESFGVLADDAIGEVVRKAQLVEIERRERLDDDGDGNVYVIGTGRVRIALPQPDDKEITLDYCGPGDLVGEVALVEGATNAQTIAADRVEAVKIPVAVLKKLIAKDLRFASRMVKILGERRLGVERRMVALLTRPVESRVAEFLSRAARRYGVPDPRGTLIGVKFTHAEIASYVGSTRETVTLVLGEFKRKKLIQFDHRRVVVMNADGLEKRI